MQQINGFQHDHPLHPMTEEETEMQSQRETLWRATTDDDLPVTFSLVDDSPDGLSFIVEEGDTEIGVTVGPEDVPAIIDALMTWHIMQSTKVAVPESVTGPRDLADTDD